MLSWNVRGPPLRKLALPLRCSTAHDFFTAQPRHSADVFILRAILHNWSDTYALKILKHLRMAAKPETRLIILEQVVLYACHEQPTPEGIECATAGPPAPAPLLANMGYANLSGYLVDMQVRRVRPSSESVRAQESRRCWLFSTGRNGRSFSFTTCSRKVDGKSNASSRHLCPRNTSRLSRSEIWDVQYVCKVET